LLKSGLAWAKAILERSHAGWLSQREEWRMVMTSYRVLCSLFIIYVAAVWIYPASAAESDKIIGPWGGSGDYPLSGDFDKDGHQDDLALFRPGTRSWEIDFDADGHLNVRSWTGPGQRGDSFVISDFDGDGFLNDVAVISSNKSWSYYTFDYNTQTRSFEGWSRWPQIRGHSIYPTPATITWSGSNDLPVAGDFDNDGHVDDLGVYRPSNHMWYFEANLDGVTDRTSGPWGASGDLPVAGDFDGDGQLGDLGLFRASDRNWYFDYSSNGNTDRKFGPWALRGDLPLAGDFDGQGLSNDICVFRPSTGQWFFKFFDIAWSPPGMHGGPEPGYVNA
jgi:hypothetical protein